VEEKAVISCLEPKRWLPGRCTHHVQEQLHRLAVSLEAGVGQTRHPGVVHEINIPHSAQQLLESTGVILGQIIQQLALHVVQLYDLLALLGHCDSIVCFCWIFQVLFGKWKSRKLHCFRRAYSDTATVSQHCPAVGVRYIVTIWYNKKIKQYHMYL